MYDQQRQTVANQQNAAGNIYNIINNDTTQARNEVSLNPLEDILFVVKHRAQFVKKGSTISSANVGKIITDLKLHLLTSEQKQFLNESSIEKIIAVIIFSVWKLLEKDKTIQIEGVTVDEIAKEIITRGVLHPS